MFQLSASTRIYLAVGATDMRKSFDTLCGVVRSWGESRENPPCDRPEKEESAGDWPDPLAGHLFVFCNRRRDRIKILYFDGTGLWLLAKRLERGGFSWPQPEEQIGGRHCAINQQELALLLGGVDMEKTKLRRWWRRF